MKALYGIAGAMLGLALYPIIKFYLDSPKELTFALPVVVTCCLIGLETYKER